ncbi:hypothetical protein SAMN04490182_3404 [Pseudomonas cedrina]|uniref:Uncharacterized protein n=2 Tax=Pseudomonas cedrina TaxID=651740 RepID=A0A1V2K1D7_PSECE|nr:hypothetical protein [Pseudomonas cedrina]ONH51523.1 hypothetical protein BLL36_21600 [Pseudomonas cedrina subsp. cedrina]SDT14063.1 hypothetical protein SAMN04490182_3404 [Pseudomonas cedrina]
MSNVSTQQFVPMNTNYAPLNQPSVQVTKPLEASASTDRVNQFLKDSSSTPKEHNGTVNKESLEKLFAMFEFAVKAMRSMLAGMGVLPKLPGELDAQPQANPGLDAKVVAQPNVKPGVEPQTDARTQVKPGPDPKVIADTRVKPGIEPQTDAGTQVKPGPDPKVVAYTDVKPKVESQTDSKPQVKQGPEVKVTPDGRAHVTLTPEAKLSTNPATTSLTDRARNDKLPADINVTVQVQSCHCPHTGEKVAREPGLTPRTDVQPAIPVIVAPPVEKHPSPTSTVIPKLDASPSLQPQVSPTTVHTPEPKPPVKPDAPASTTVLPKPEARTTPDLTSPAPDERIGTSRGFSRGPSEERCAPKPSLRQRF